LIARGFSPPVNADVSGFNKKETTMPTMTINDIIHADNPFKLHLTNGEVLSVKFTEGYNGDLQDPLLVFVLADNSSIALCVSVIAFGESVK
jgi:hypothetical protein